MLSLFLKQYLNRVLMQVCKHFWTSIKEDGTELPIITTEGKTYIIFSSKKEMKQTDASKHVRLSSVVTWYYTRYPKVKLRDR